MEYFDLIRVLGIPDMLLDPLEEGHDLGQVVLGLDVLLQQDVYGFLANIENLLLRRESVLVYAQGFFAFHANPLEYDRERSSAMWAVPSCTSAWWKLAHDST